MKDESMEKTLKEINERISAIEETFNSELLTIKNVRQLEDLATTICGYLKDGNDVEIIMRRKRKRTR
jgi:hypothetical protein